MKKRISKIWGVGIIVTLLASLLVIAAPVSAADPLQWNDETLATTSNEILNSGSDIYDFSIANDGTTIFAVGRTSSDNTVLWKSATAGRTWVNISTTALGFPTSTNATIQYVAVAPDSPSVLAVAGYGDATNTGTTYTWVYASTNGGANWSQLGSTSFANAINSVAISSTVSPGIRYVAVPGNSGASDAAALFYFELGMASPVWKNAVTYDATGATGFSGTPKFSDLSANAAIDSFKAITFSPNFSADYTAVALSETTGLNGNLQLHVLGFNQKNWNAFTSYPVTVKQRSVAGSLFSIQAADVALAPDYVGSDDVSRVAFVGFAATDNGTPGYGGIYRCTDSQTPKDVKGSTIDIYSVAFNGSTLVAGGYADNIVWRCADPLTITPTTVASRTDKRIGLLDSADKTIVAWNGTEVLGAKRGAMSAFSVSVDSGMSWNDVSLIDTVLTNITDMLVTPDGSRVYFVSDDGTNTSVFRQTGSTWERVLSVSGLDKYFLRGAPDNNDTVWVVDDGAAGTGNDIYYTTDAGQARWYHYSYSGAITDLASESKDIVYIASSTKVYKSTNGGFTWNSGTIPELSGGNVATVRSLGANKVIAGGATGFVSFTTDGATTWVKISKPMLGTGGSIQAIASTLDTGDFIYASGSTVDTDIYRWTVGDTPAEDWKKLTTTQVDATEGAYGIALVGSALYVSYNGSAAKVLRCLNPNAPAAWEWSILTDTAKKGNLTPSALKVSKSGTDTKLWFVNQTTTDSVRSYIDTLATVGPTISSPADKLQNPMNPITGRSVDIAFNWSRPSVNVNMYDIEVYNDAAGKNRVLRTRIEERGTSPVIVLGPFQSSATTRFLEWTPGQTYYWKVRVSPREAQDATATAGYTGPVYSAWSELRSITIQPGAAMVPSIGSPANGATITATTPSFSWSPVSGATEYEFQLALNTDFASPVASQKMASTGVRPIVKLNTDMTYFWRVRATKPVVGDWSTISNFTVAAPVEPTPPVVIEPAPVPIINLPPITMPPAIVNLPPAAPASQPISAGLLWAVIIIGAILVIALIVLIVRTRRTV